MFFSYFLDSTEPVKTSQVAWLSFVGASGPCLVHPCWEKREVVPQGMVGRRRQTGNLLGSANGEVSSGTVEVELNLELTERTSSTSCCLFLPGTGGEVWNTPLRKSHKWRGMRTWDNQIGGCWCKGRRIPVFFMGILLNWGKRWLFSWFCCLHRTKFRSLCWHLLLNAVSVVDLEVFSIA